MTQRQLEIANKMLKWYADKDGITSSDTWDNSDIFKEYKWIEPGQVRHILRQQGYMIPTDDGQTIDMLTEKGWKAVKASSIEEYLRQTEEAERNKYLNISKLNLNLAKNPGQQIINDGSPSSYNQLNEVKTDKKNMLKTISLIMGCVAALVTISYYLHELLK